MSTPDTKAAWSGRMGAPPARLPGGCTLSLTHQRLLDLPNAEAARLFRLGRVRLYVRPRDPHFRTGFPPIGNCHPVIVAKGKEAGTMRGKVPAKAREETTDMNRPVSGVGDHAASVGLELDALPKMSGRSTSNEMPVLWLIRRARSMEGRRSPRMMRVMVEGSTPSSLASAAGFFPDS